MSAFEFAVLASLRAAQLMRGCTPRVEGGHTTGVTAQLEVAAGKVVRAVEGTVQDPPGTIGVTEASAVVRNEDHRDGLRVGRNSSSKPGRVG